MSHLHSEANALVNLAARLLDVVRAAVVLQRRQFEFAFHQNDLVVARDEDRWHVERNAVHAGAAAQILCDLDDYLLSVRRAAGLVRLAAQR